MGSVQGQYTKEMFKKFGYHATWLPGVNLELGDIGTINGGVFTRKANLRDLDITFTKREDTTKTNLEYHSEGGVSVTTKLSGKSAPASGVLGDVDAGLIVEFKKDKAILFKAKNTVSPSIQDAISLGTEILKRYEAGNWEKENVIITEILEAETATILISNQANTTVGLRAQANINAAHFDIADAGFNFGVEVKGGLESNIVAQEGATPLFKVMGVRNRIFQPSIFKSQMNFPVYSENFDAKKDSGKEVISFDYLDEEDTEK